MTAKLTAIATERDTYTDDVVLILNEAIENARAYGITSCAIVLANEQTTLVKSCHLDRLRLMGALAQAMSNVGIT